METEGVIWLRAIQDGSIYEYLTEFSELKEMRLTSLRRKVMYATVDLNKKGLFPKMKSLKKLIGCSNAGLQGCIRYLKKYVLVVDVTIPELLNIFEIRRGTVLHLPPQLDCATSYGLSNMRTGKRGGIMSWDERKQNPRAPNFSHYLIALISENGLPVFKKSFSFLERYKL